MRAKPSVKLCECGCGEPAPIATKNNRGYTPGEPLRFINQHHLRKGSFGISIDKTRHGRAKVACRDRSHVYFYRAVMEAHLGRHLTSDEHVHHINGDPTDDRLENLELVSPAEHRHIHAPSHCRRGHPLSGDNLYVSPGGQRQCRECVRVRRRLRKNKEEK